jgi:hypothetical protein
MHCRRAFDVFEFFLIIPNIMLGIGSALGRTIKTFALYVWFLPRMDHSTLSHSFENIDAGIQC